MTVPVAPVPPFNVAYVDLTANPLAGGSIQTFLAGTTTPLATYSDPFGAVPNETTIELNNAGQNEAGGIYLDITKSYKFIWFDSQGNQVDVVNNIEGNPYLTSLTGGSDIIVSNNTISLNYPRTASEISAGVTPTNLSYLPGYFRRYGAVGDGTTDDRVAVQNAINSNDSVWGYQGDIYAINGSLTFPLGGPHYYNFQGSILRGTSTTAQPYLVKIGFENTIMIDYHVDTFNATTNPNTNYACQTWWYNGTSSSQYNVVFGMRHSYGIRGMVYGAPVGSSGALALNAGVSSGSTTATLAVSWSFPTESYNVVFSDGTVRACVFTNNSATITWTTGIPNNVTSSAFCTSTAFAQSENSIHGWRTRGMQNPFYSNHINGIIFFSEPIFVSFYEEWTVQGNFNWNNARAVEAYYGAVVWHGGEIELAGSNVGFAADLSNSYVTNCIIETACPIKIVGDNVQISGGNYLNTQTTTAGFTIAGGVTGLLSLSDIEFKRPDNVGSFSNQPLVDSTMPGGLVFTSPPASGSTSSVLTTPWPYTSATVPVTFPDGEVKAVTFIQGITAITWTGGLSNTQGTANATMPFETFLANTKSFEWPWRLAAANNRLVNCNANSIARYRNHRLNISSADPNIYLLNTNTTESLLDIIGFDRLGYTTNGWVLNNLFGSSTTMTATTNTGPSKYNAAQITLHATGNAEAVYGDPTSLTTLKATAFRVAPGDLYWISAWCNNSAGTGGTLVVDFFNSAGTGTSRVVVADSSSIPANSWGFVEGPVAVPAASAYACPGVFGNVSDIQVTDLRFRRAN